LLLGVTEPSSISRGLKAIGYIVKQTNMGLVTEPSSISRGLKGPTGT